MQKYKEIGKWQRKLPVFSFVLRKMCNFARKKLLLITIMTSALQKIQSTPMAPYVSLMEKMSNQDKVAVATFLVAMVPYAKVVEEQPPQSNAEIIREKYKNLKRSPRVEKLMQMREEAAKYVDLTDERTKHILGVDS